MMTPADASRIIHVERKPPRNINWLLLVVFALVAVVALLAARAI